MRVAAVERNQTLSLSRARIFRSHAYLPTQTKQTLQRRKKETSHRTNFKIAINFQSLQAYLLVNTDLIFFLLVQRPLEEKEVG
jgi:hypothetical protein